MHQRLAPYCPWPVQKHPPDSLYICNILSMSLQCHPEDSIIHNGCATYTLHSTKLKNIKQKPACCMKMLLKRVLPLHALPCYQYSFNSLRNTVITWVYPAWHKHPGIKINKAAMWKRQPDTRWLKIRQFSLCVVMQVCLCCVSVSWITAGCVMKTHAWAKWVVEQVEQRSSCILSTVSIKLFRLWQIYVYHYV